jgi:IS1 family transposase
MCIQLSPSFWIWIAVSRMVGQILGFMIGDRTDLMLSDLWNDIPKDYQKKPVYTDGLGAYARFFASDPRVCSSQHHPTKKGSGETNHSEGLNTKCRQRQSGLVRESCGVHRGITDDIYERFLIFVFGHNEFTQRRWIRRMQKDQPTLQNA